jgi:hypothetical protein
MIIVGGSQRSGTSATQQLLCQLPEANPYLYEASFLRMQVACYADAKASFSNNHASYFGDMLQLRNFQAGVVSAFLDHTTRIHGNCEHLILKEPHLTMYWPDLYELVPDVWFLMMIRDPRDVIASMIQVGERQKQLGQDYMFTDRNIRRLCEHFVAFYRPSFEVTDADFRDRLAVLHYENVVNDPRTALEQIAGFTGISFDSVDPGESPDHGMVDQDVISGSRHFQPWATEVNGKQITPSRIGRYQEVLTQEETRLVEEYCADYFEWFGYSRQAHESTLATAQMGEI